jgi:hypothetical protein
MRKQAKFFRLTILGLACSGALAFFLSGQSAAGSFLPMTTPLQENARDLYKHPKIESALCRLIHIFRTQGFATMKQMATEHNLDFAGDLLRVTVVTQDYSSGTAAKLIVPRLTQRITSLGGKVETSYGSDVQSLLPIDAVLQVAEEAQVRRIRLPLKPRTCSITSEGVAKTGANAWQDLTSPPQPECGQSRHPGFGLHRL